MRNAFVQRMASARIAAREAGLGAAVVVKTALDGAARAPRRLWALLAIGCFGALVVSAASHGLLGGEFGSRVLAEFVGRPLNMALIYYLIGYVVCSGAWHALTVCRRLGREEMTRASFILNGGRRSNVRRHILTERDR